ncbi:MAG: PLP-dependent aminotransferase family protein [Trueperaceae bacterium]
MNFSNHFAQRTTRLKPSAIREILKLTQKSSVISFAGGLPAPGLFPVERIKEASLNVLSKDGTQALQYSTTEGYLPFREWIAARHETKVENVLVTCGSQQGLDIIAKLFLNPGDKVVVAEPTYLGAVQIFDSYEAQYLGIPCDDDGMTLEGLEAALKQKPKLVYAIPNFDNPRGTTMSLERRKKLVALAQKYSVPIYEDDPYGEIRFEADTIPSLYELAPELVIYGGTFSKMVVPGFRLGWIIAPTQVLAMASRAKQATDLHTATFTQMIAFDIAKDNFMDEQIERVRSYYRKQRDLMLGSIEKYFPEDVHFTRPKGGMFLWVTLPKDKNALALLEEAVKRDVAYVPGEPFFANGGGKNTLRLSYSIAAPQQVETGIKRLGELFNEEE